MLCQKKHAVSSIATPQEAPMFRDPVRPHIYVAALAFALAFPFFGFPDPAPFKIPEADA
jgi:hypothetical protein